MIEITDELLGEEDMMCIVPYSLLESYHFLLSERCLGRIKAEKE